MKRKTALLLLCLVFLGMAGYAGFQLYRQWSEYRAGEQLYRELSQYAQPDLAAARDPTTEKQPLTPATGPDAPSAEAAPADTGWPTVDFEALRAINPDVVAWICIEGTNINYPVVQGADNSYYLDRLFDGSRNRAGSIFMDYRNEADFSDRNTILYGHHMQNGSMFHQITKYKDQAFYDEHPVCLVMTPGKNYRLAFFAGYVTDLNAQAWKLEFGSDEEYAQWLEDAISRSTFQSTVRPAAQDRVVTFSTCTYEYNDARYVLAGILTETP